ncbi:hypothetical protein DL93DRAFT_2091695 [Clavulina sp. PMI_390]|nr:hypothetical protein DL93DRAFT_2091695 [Clavulina sp. PMI_390]
MPGGNLTDLTVTESHQIRGARLSTANQKTMYKGIRHKKNKETSQVERTEKNMEGARIAALEISGTNPTNTKIWCSLLRNKNIPNNIRIFLWKLMHSAHKVGPYWRRIPNYKERSQCTGETCKGELESMEHILLECPHNHGEAVWEIAQQILRKKEIDWPGNFSLDHIRACGITEICKNEDENNTRRPGATRLFTIIISECAFIIWKLRNERIFANKTDANDNNDDNDEPQREITRTEAQNRALSALDTRLTVDCLTLRIGKLSPKQWGKHKNKVLRTWSGVVVNRDGSSLPEDWIKTRGVLVGRLPRQPLDNG